MPGQQQAPVGYAKYLHSQHWMSVKRRTWEYYRGYCVHCKRSLRRRKGEVHHTNYECLNREVVGTDVVLLCCDCHESIHKYGLVLKSTEPVKKPKKKDNMRGCGSLWNSRDYRIHLKKNPPIRIPPSTGVESSPGMPAGES